MEKVYHKPNRAHRHPMVIWSRLKLRWPLLVWLVAIVLLAFMFNRGERYRTLMGMVEVVSDEFAHLESARLLEVRVRTGDVVQAGDVLAVFDSSQLAAEMEVERLQVERQFTSEVQRLDEERRSLQLNLAETQAELSVLEDELARMQPLLDKRIIDAQSLSSIKARQAALAKAAELYPESITAVEKERDAAMQRMKSTLSWLSADTDSPAPADAPGRRLLSLLKVRHDGYTLKARRDGIVSRTYYRPGDVVPSGNPVLSVVATDPVRIVGFLPEASSHDVTVGMPATIQSMRRNSEIYSGRVTAMGPEVLALPGRVSAIPGRTERGLRVVLEPNGIMDAKPGETVRIRIIRPGDDWLTGMMHSFQSKDAQ